MKLEDEEYEKYMEANCYFCPLESIIRFYRLELLRKEYSIFTLRSAINNTGKGEKRTWTDRGNCTRTK